MAKVASKATDVARGTVTFAFVDGSKVVADINKMSADIVRQLALHGLAQKGGDAYAGAKGDAVAAHEACKTVIDGLVAGEWEQRGNATSMLADAIARVTGKDITAISAELAKMDEKAKKAIRGEPRVKAALAEIAAERAQAAADRAAQADDTDALDLDAMF